MASLGCTQAISTLEGEGARVDDTEAGQVQQQETRKPLREPAQPWSEAHQRAERRSGQLHSRVMTTPASQVCSAGSST